jgi:hypothetical protein
MTDHQNTGSKTDKTEEENRREDKSNRGGEFDQSILYECMEISQ